MISRRHNKNDGGESPSNDPDATIAAATNGAEPSRQRTRPSSSTSVAESDGSKRTALSVVLRLTGRSLPPRVLNEDETRVLEITVFRHLEHALGCLGVAVVGDGGDESGRPPSYCRVTSVRVAVDSMRPMVPLVSEVGSNTGVVDERRGTSLEAAMAVGLDTDEPPDELGDRVAEAIVGTDELLRALRSRVGVSAYDGAYFDHVTGLELSDVVLPNRRRPPTLVAHNKAVALEERYDHGAYDNTSYFLYGNGFMTVLVVVAAGSLVTLTVCFLRKTGATMTTGVPSSASSTTTRTTRTTTSSRASGLVAPPNEGTIATITTIVEGDEYDEADETSTIRSGTLAPLSNRKTRRVVRFEGVMDTYREDESAMT